LAQHERAAQERGIPFVVADIAGVNLDVDQADDLLLLAEREGATATQRLLRELSVTERVMCV
ncbi:hypothetical protein SE17_40715, partial [Kouleothrix aurantiaca]